MKNIQTILLSVAILGSFAFSYYLYTEAKQEVRYAYNDVKAKMERGDNKLNLAIYEFEILSAKSIAEKAGYTFENYTFIESRGDDVIFKNEYTGTYLLVDRKNKIIVQNYIY